MSLCTHYSYQDNKNGGQNTNNCFLKKGKNWKLNKAYHWDSHVHYYSGVKNKIYYSKPKVVHHVKHIHKKHNEIIHHHDHYHHHYRQHYFPNDQYYYTYEPNYDTYEPNYDTYEPNYYTY